MNVKTIKYCSALFCFGKKYSWDSNFCLNCVNYYRLQEELSDILLVTTATFKVRLSVQLVSPSRSTKPAVTLAPTWTKQSVG